jgi:hypothetical protein
MTCVFIVDCVEWWVEKKGKEKKSFHIRLMNHVEVFQVFSQSIAARRRNVSPIKSNCKPRQPFVPWIFPLPSAEERSGRHHSMAFPVQELVNSDEPDVGSHTRGDGTATRAFFSVFQQLITELRASVRLASRVLETSICINYR